MKKSILVLGLILAGIAGGTEGCKSTNGQQGVVAIEQMSDVDYSRWKLYITLGTKIAANRLVQSGKMTQKELDAVATVLETVRDQTVVPGATSIITPALQKAGLTGDEVQLLMAIVEQELLARGALDWIDPATGVVALSPRTKELLTVVAGSLRNSAAVTDAEHKQAKELQTQFNDKLMQ